MRMGLPMHRITAALLAALLAVAAGGCGGAGRPNKYYRLEIPEVASPPAGTYPVSLLVARINAPHLYRDARIVYQAGSQELGTYEYHRWAEPPTEMIESLLAHLLRESGRYKSVQTQKSNARGDYIIRGRLYNLEEISGSPLLARVTFEFELYDVKTGTTVWSQFYKHDEPVSGPGKDKGKVAHVVEALDRNVKRGLEQMVSGIDQYFTTHPPK
jgi:ABC-type uncharacterized transport system auxiliary subunit